MTTVFSRYKASIHIYDQPGPSFDYDFSREGANTAFNQWGIVDAPNVSTIVSTASDASGPAFWESLGQIRGLYLGLILANDGKMYSPPFSEGGNVLVVDPNTDTTSVESFGVSGYLYNGQNYITGALAPNGKIYCPPFNPGYDKGVLVLDPSNSTSYEIPLSIAPGTTKLYSTAVLGANGLIYCLGSEDCLIINPNNDTTIYTTFNGVIPSFGISTTDRWSGGVKCLADDKLYFVSRYTSNVIVIDTSTSYFGTASSKTFGSGAMAAGQTYIGIANGKKGLLNLAPWRRTLPATTRYWTYVNPITETSVDDTLSTPYYDSRGAVSGDDGGVYSIPWTDAAALDRGFVYNRTGDSGNVNQGLLGLDISSVTGTGGTGPRWWGGCPAPNGKIYCLPDMSYWSTSRNQVLRKSIVVLEPNGNAIVEMGATKFRDLVKNSYFNKGGT